MRPSRRTMAKIPSVGMTQLPVSFLISQSLWHFLPICVTSSRVSPTRRRVPMGRDFSSKPRVRMFSAKSPGCRVRPRARILSTLSSASRLICRCQFPAWASPTIPWPHCTRMDGTSCFRVPLRSLIHTAVTSAMSHSPFRWFPPPLSRRLSVPAVRRSRQSLRSRAYQCHGGWRPEPPTGFPLPPFRCPAD